MVFKGVSHLICESSFWFTSINNKVLHEFVPVYNGIIFSWVFTNLPVSWHGISSNFADHVVWLGFDNSFYSKKRCMMKRWYAYSKYEPKIECYFVFKRSSLKFYLSLLKIPIPLFNFILSWESSLIHCNCLSKSAPRDLNAGFV